MLHDHVISFLETAMVFLLLTNAISAAAAISALRLLKLQQGVHAAPGGIQRRLAAILGFNT